MDLMTLAAKLYRGGFDSRQAGDIVLWMAEPFKYNRLAGLAALVDYYEEADRMFPRKEPKKVGVRID